MQCTDSMSCYNEVEIRWQPPTTRWIKINFDYAPGEHSNPCLSGCRGLVCNENGMWHGGFVKNLGSCFSSVTKLWGALKAL